VRSATGREQFGAAYPLVIDGKRVTTDDWIRSVNPASTTEVVGQVAKAMPEHADRAVAAAAGGAGRPGARHRTGSAPTSCAGPHRSCAGGALSWMRCCPRSGQTLAGGRRRHCRGPSTSATTTPRDRADVRPAADAQASGETNVYFYEPRGVVLVVAAVELPDGHPLRHDRRRPGHRQTPW